MSSESGGESHRSETPRKRRRLYSTNPGTRKHEAHRRPDLEENYNDNYRLLFNEHVAAAASRPVTDASLQHYAKQVGSSVWSSREQDTCFAALERLGRDDLPGIAAAVATKTAAETRDYLLLLQDAAFKQRNVHVALRDIPAAIELGDGCSQQLEEASDALAWYQEKLEATQEQERYGEYWLITPQIAEDIEDAVAGLGRPRNASTPRISESEGSSRGIAGACTLCRKRKSRCDRGHPCNNCTKQAAECVYMEHAWRVAAPRRVSSLDASSKDTKSFHDRSRPTAARREEEEDSRRFGPGVAGACVSCKKRKLKCDRRAPCTNCTRFKADCLYKKNPPEGVEQHLGHTIGLGEHDNSDVRSGQRPVAHLLDALPEGHLLRPEAMLKLSRELFMNRSNDFPSPWLHWSMYTSELATEPSIYRTAFRDLHRLTISITQRLVKTAIMQTTSRLRAQRQRGSEKHPNKGHHPLIKKRDIRAAVDVLGMRKNGRERWIGVSRRCGLRVTVKDKTAKGRREKVLRWEEVERLLVPPLFSEEHLPFGDGLSTEPEHFKLRAARSGTPLPLHNFATSDLEDGIATDSTDDSDAILDDHCRNEQQRRTSKSQPRNVAGKYASLPPAAIDNDEHRHQVSTLEDFDREATRHEERTLRELLGHEATTKGDFTKRSLSNCDPDDTLVESYATVTQDWRQFTEFRATWEIYEKPASCAQFLGNQRTPSSMPSARRHIARTAGSSPCSTDDDGFSDMAARTRGIPTKSIELRARGTNAHAALQSGGFERSDDPEAGSDSDAGNSELDKDVPAQSVEFGNGAEGSMGIEEGMEWSSS